MKLGLFLGLCCIVASGVVGCAGTEPGESTSTTEQAVTGAIAITGTLTGAQGAPVAGATVRLSGSSQATTTTAANGTYSFSGLSSGSYSVQPSLAGCTFAPSVVNLNNLNASTTANFSGSGSSCGGNPPPDGGANSGPLSLSGQVVSATGAPVSGVRVSLNGSTQGFRITGAAGTYSFQVNPGSYSLSASGVCTSFTPSTANLNGVTTSETQNFVGQGCPTPPADAGTDTGTGASSDAAVTDAATPDASGSDASGSDAVAPPIPR